MVDFGFSKDQELVRKSVREFLEKECPMDQVRTLKTDAKGYDPKVWRKMVELGFVGMAIPEAYEGMGGDFLDLMIFMEEAGRHLLQAPYFTSVVLCGLPLARFGNESQKQSGLRAIADGKIWSLAILEEAADYEAQNIKLTAARSVDRYTLNGVKLFVPFAGAAEKLLVVARTQAGGDPQAGLTVFIVDAGAPGVSMQLIPTAARDQRYEVRFADVAVPAANVLGRPEGGWEVVEHLLQHAAVLKSAEMSGGAQAVLELTRRYAAERVQFGKPIGSMQAIQHRLANAFIGVQGLKNLVYEAAWHLNAGLPRPELAAMAKVKANAVFQHACIEGITIHGAIGFTDEMDVGLYHLRTKAMEFDLGGSDFHRERMMRELEKQVPDFMRL